MGLPFYVESQKLRRSNVKRKRLTFCIREIKSFDSKEAPRFVEALHEPLVVCMVMKWIWTTVSARNDRIVGLGN